MRRLTGALERVGGITKRPPIWGVVGGGLALAGGPRGRDAALRGGVAYGLAAILANVVIKPVVKRDRPHGSSEHARIGPLTSSFPSGHAATDLAFVFGVSQRMPPLFLPLSICTFAAHWSLVRSRAHHVSDILAGGALGIGVALIVGALWPDGADAGGSRNPDRPNDKDDERLMTEIDGEPARLLVHIEPLEEPGPAATGGTAPDPA